MEAPEQNHLEGYWCNLNLSSNLALYCIALSIHKYNMTSNRINKYDLSHPNKHFNYWALERKTDTENFKHDGSDQDHDAI